MIDYFALARPCRTTNEFNRLHIDLERYLAPLEIAHIAKGAEKLSRDSRSWLERIRSLSPALLDVPQHYRRRVLTEHISIYQQPNYLGPRKQLLVAFTGNKGRLMLPLAVFLQILDSRSWDVVVVWKDRPGISYMAGHTDVADDFPGLVHYIEKIVGAGRYRRIATIGISGGGYAAIIAATLLRASRGVSVGGSLPPESARDCGHPLGSLIGSANLEFRFVFAERNALDRREAEAMVDVFGGRLYPISATDDHNVFRKLLERGELLEFVREAIGDDPGKVTKWRQSLGPAFRRWQK